MTDALYGLTAEFRTADDLVRAAAETRAAGFRRIEAYAPFAIDELEHVIPHWNPLPLLVLAAGLTGTLTGYVLQTYIAVYDYPINIGGRPLHSLPSFIVIMFEYRDHVRADRVVCSCGRVLGHDLPGWPAFPLPLGSERTGL